MIVGHEDALRRLWAAAARDGLHHALLFEGPDGVGKRAVALRLAMAVNCTASAPGDGVAACPCGRCPTCVAIAGGVHPDVQIVSPPADSRTIPVDVIREVIRRAGYHRYGAKQRVIIIDPAEAMQPAAANALLKTLEEPLPGTGFVLVSAAASALLPTIRSRCQRVRFGALPAPRLADWLRGRGIAEPEALAAAAEGCPGRALTLADGGLAERRALRDRLLTGLAGDLAALMTLAQELAEGKKGGRVALSLDLLEELVRDAAIAATGAQAPLTHPDRAAAAAAWGVALWPTGIVALSEAIRAARDQLTVNVAARLVLDGLLTTVATELGPARKLAA